MPSYPRLTKTPQVFVANQTFEDYIVIKVDGVPMKVRAFRRAGPNGADIFGWEQEIDGQWAVVTERESD